MGTDVASEGLAISPDGTMISTINMRNTSFPPKVPRFQREASLTLLGMDPETGIVQKLSDRPLDGVLPEGGAFDLTGDHFLTTVFSCHNGATADNGPGVTVSACRKANSRR